MRELNLVEVESVSGAEPQPLTDVSDPNDPVYGTSGLGDSGIGIDIGGTGFGNGPGNSVIALAIQADINGDGSADASASVVNGELTGADVTFGNGVTVGYDSSLPGAGAEDPTDPTDGNFITITVPF